MSLMRSFSRFFIYKVMFNKSTSEFNYQKRSYAEATMWPV